MIYNTRHARNSSHTLGQNVSCRHCLVSTMCPYRTVHILHIMSRRGSHMLRHRKAFWKLFRKAVQKLYGPCTGRVTIAKMVSKN